MAGLCIFSVPYFVIILTKYREKTIIKMLWGVMNFDIGENNKEEEASPLLLCVLSYEKITCAARDPSSFLNVRG